MRIVASHAGCLSGGMDENFYEFEDSGVLFLLPVDFGNFTQKVVLCDLFKIWEGIVNSHCRLVDHRTNDDESILDTLDRQSLAVFQQNFSHKLCYFFIDLRVNRNSIEVSLDKQTNGFELLFEHFVILLDFGQTQNTNNECFIFGNVVLFSIVVFGHVFLIAVTLLYLNKMLQDVETRLQKFIRHQRIVLTSLVIDGLDLVEKDDVSDQLIAINDVCHQLSLDPLELIGITF